MTPRTLSIPVLIAVITLPLYVFDQITKWLVLRNLDYQEMRSVVPGFFDLVRFHNTGAAFSMFSNSNAFFIGLSVVALAVLAILARRGTFRESMMRFGLALLLAGILGNLTDRLLHGYVVDFLLFDLHVPFAHPWPAFNVADSCICTATALFLWQSFRESKCGRE